MEGLPELIMREGERRDVRDVLKQNKHALITMSQSIVPQTEDHPSSAASHSTELLQAIQRLLCMNGSPLAVSVLLAIQAEELPSMPQIHQTFTNLGLQHIANISIVHAQSCHQELVVISHALVDLLSAQRLSYLLITPLLQLARAMTPSPDCLTAIHADVLQACLASRHYSTAVDFIDRNIISEISPQECYLPSIDYLRFFFYAGCALLPLRRYEEALGYFTTAITAPANALSHVVIHAIKKARLTSLLVTGADLVLPQ